MRKIYGQVRHGAYNSIYSLIDARNVENDEVFKRIIIQENGHNFGLVIVVALSTVQVNPESILI